MRHDVALTVDYCGSCDVIWFDHRGLLIAAGKFFAVPPSPEKLLAAAFLERERSLRDVEELKSSFGRQYGSLRDMIASLFGIPIEEFTAPRNLPLGTYGIVLINVLVFLLEAMSGEGAAYFRTWGFVPAEFPTRVLPVFTSMFIHGSAMHLFGNMYFLWMCGDNVEDVYGRWFIGLYLACGVVATLPHYAFYSDSAVPAVGASGAVVAVLTIYALTFGKARFRMTFLYILTYRFPAWFSWFSLFCSSWRSAATAGYQVCRSFGRCCSRLSHRPRQEERKPTSAMVTFRAPGSSTARGNAA